MMVTVVMVTGTMTGAVTNSQLSFCALVLSTQQISPHLVPTATLGVGTIMTPFLR